MKLKLQLKYVKERNILVDIKIFLSSFKIHFFDGLMNRTKVPKLDIENEEEKIVSKLVL